MAQEKILCSNDHCYDKYYPSPLLEPRLCENCSLLVLKTKIAYLDTLKSDLRSDTYWAEMRMNLKKLKALEEEY